MPNCCNKPCKYCLQSKEDRCENYSCLIFGIYVENSECDKIMQLNFDKDKKLENFIKLSMIQILYLTKNYNKLKLLNFEKSILVEKIIKLNDFSILNKYFIDEKKYINDLIEKKYISFYEKENKFYDLEKLKNLFLQYMFLKFSLKSYIKEKLIPDDFKVENSKIIKDFENEIFNDKNLSFCRLYDSKR